MERIQCRACEHKQPVSDFCRRCGRSLPTQHQPAPAAVEVVKIVERPVPAIDLSQTFEQVERTVILARVDHFNGNMIAAARSLGLGRNTVYRKVRSYRCDGAQNGTSTF
jgi:transcriptional regulator of acetoin/glycerol metabolism